MLPFFELSQQRCHTSCQHSTSLTLCLCASRQPDDQRGLLPGHVDFLIVPIHGRFFANPEVEIPDSPGKGQPKFHGAQTTNPGSISTVMFQAWLVLDEQTLVVSLAFCRYNSSHRKRTAAKLVFDRIHNPDHQASAQVHNYPGS